MPAFSKRRNRIYLIQDNASYHKKPEVYDWFKMNRNKIEVFQLPPYSPEFNAIECVWGFTRKQVTHNRYFDTIEALCGSIFAFFDNIINCPSKFLGLLRPFF